MFSPWKVCSCSPYSVGVYFCALYWPAPSQTSSNKQDLFEIQSGKIIGQLHLLAVREKGCAGVLPSRCGQVGKGIQVFAFRVVPGTERG